MPNDLKYVADPLLTGNTIVASFQVARELRCVLQGLDWNIEFSPTQPEDQINMAPEIHGKMCEFMDQMTALNN